MVIVFENTFFKDYHSDTAWTGRLNNPCHLPIVERLKSHSRASHASARTNSVLVLMLVVR